ncbi:Phage lysozyme [compost metagenome]
MTASVQPKNLGAFLDMLAWSELGSTNLKRSDDGYNVIVTGSDGVLELFDDYADHPFANGRKSKVIRPATVSKKALTSNAAGRYQQMLKDWPHYRDLLKLKDFGHISQDKVAIQHIKECRALPDIEAGRIQEAIAKCANIWASLPGAGYGQREHKLTNLLEQYVRAGGELE